jgi:predicted anti-sigma-YlaC factor YlaD
MNNSYHTAPEDNLVCKELVELVTLYLERGLSERDSARFEAHLAECEDCRAYLEQMSWTIRLAGQLRQPSLSPEDRAQLHTLFAGLRDLHRS